MATNRIDDYLNEAVGSVFQSVDVEIELVLVLDGIQLPDVAPHWATKPNVKVVTRKHSEGLAAALNTGIKAASNEIIARLDADDRAMPQRFIHQLRTLQNDSPPILVGSRTIIIDEFGNQLGIADQPCGADIRVDLLLQNVVPHSTYMLRKSDAIRVGMYDESLRQMEDYDFLLRLGQLGRIEVLCDRLIEYRAHSGQMSKKASARANYITAVGHGRRALGAHLGRPRIEVETKHLFWKAVQFARSNRMIRPGHLRGLTSSESRFDVNSRSESE